MKWVSVFSVLLALGISQVIQAMPTLQDYIASHPRWRDQQQQHMAQFQQWQTAVMKVPTSILTSSTPPPKQAISPLLRTTSMGLSPGKPAIHTLPIALTQPIVLLGNDTASRTWLHHHAHWLRQHHVVGFCVTHCDWHTLAAYHRLAPSLPVFLLNGAKLPAAWHIEHTPAVILSHQP